MSKADDHLVFTCPDCCKMLQHWATEGKIPRLIFTAESEVHWCNPEFEDLVGYTLAEFHRGIIDLKRLTVTQLELETEAEMIRQVLACERRDYTLVKTYQNRTKGQVRVQSCVQRWPPEASDQVLFLCEVVPLAGHHPATYETAQRVLERLAEDVKRMREELLQVHSDMGLDRDRKTQMVDVLQWVIDQVQAHPKTAMTIAAVVLSLVLGEAGVALAMRILKAVYGTSAVPAIDGEP